MSRLLKFDPRHPPLWRVGGEIQFGAEPVVRLAEPEPWQEGLISELDRGVPESALPVLASRYGVGAEEARSLLTVLAPAVVRPSSDRPLRAVLEAPRRDPTIIPFKTALEAAGVATIVVDGGDRVPDASERALPRLLIAHNAVDPRRAREALRDDVAHLSVVFTGSRAVVGPLVVPGRTGCLACLDAHRTDADAEWPVLLGQLLGRSPAPVSAALAADAGVVTGWLLRDPDLDPLSITLNAGSPQRSVQTHVPHERCACRSLPETATERAESGPAPGPT